MLILKIRKLFKIIILGGMEMSQQKETYKENVDYILKKLANRFCCPEEEEREREKTLRESKTCIKEIINILNTSISDLPMEIRHNFHTFYANNGKLLLFSIDAWENENIKLSSFSIDAWDNKNIRFRFLYDIIEEYAKRYLVRSVSNVKISIRSDLAYEEGYLVSYENVYFKIAESGRNVNIKRVDVLEEYLKYGIEVIPYENILSNTIPDTYEKRKEYMKNFIEHLEKAKKVGITKAQLIRITRNI